MAVVILVPAARVGAQALGLSRAHIAESLLTT